MRRTWAKGLSAARSALSADGGIRVERVETATSQPLPGGVNCGRSRDEPAPWVLGLPLRMRLAASRPLRRLDSFQGFFSAVSQSEQLEQAGFVTDLRVIKLGGYPRQRPRERSYLTFSARLALGSVPDRSPRSISWNRRWRAAAPRFVPRLDRRHADSRDAGSR